MVKHILYIRADAAAGSNAARSRFDGDSSAVDAEWTQVKTTTPYFLTAGTEVRLAWKIDTNGEILDSLGAAQASPVGAFPAYDPGSQAQNMLTIAGVGSDGETFTIGNDVYELDTTVLTGITAGRIRVNVSGGSTVAASKVLTLSGNAVADETVVVGATTYTWKAAAGAANTVLVGADAAASIVNLVAAINGAAGSGTLYGAGTTANASCAAVGDATTVTVTAKIPGAGGNSIAISETMTNGAWAGGATNLGDGVSPTVGEVVAAIINAINYYGTEGVEAMAYSTDTVVVFSKTPQPTTLACAETMANGSWASTAMSGGRIPKYRQIAVSKRVPTAAEVTKGAMAFKFNFTVTSVVVAVITTATGANVAYDGKRIISGGLVVLDNTGSADWAATSTVTVIAFD